MKINTPSPSRNKAKKWFKVRLAIGIAGYVQADYYEVTDSLIIFYTQPDDQPVATYSIVSVSSVEEILNDTTSKVLLQFEAPVENRKAS